jgi:hypothetical protein
MSDQGKWFKVWTSILTDSGIQNLELENIGRWCLFGAYMKLHGNKGKLSLVEPERSLQNLLRVTTFDSLKQQIKNLPNVTIDDRHNLVTIKNWHKFQIDSSKYRMKQKRIRDGKCDDLRREEKRRDKKRTEDIKTPPLPPSGGNGVVVQETPEKLTDVQRVILAFKLTTGHDLQDKAWDKAFFRRYARSGKDLLDYLGSWREATDCIEWVVDKMRSKNLSFTMETIVKHMADYKLEVMGRRQ